METTEVFPSGFPLQGLPELTDEVFFAFHPVIRKIIYLNKAFEEIWNISRNAVTSDLSLLINSVHADDQLMVKDTFEALQKDEKKSIEFRIQLPDRTVRWIKVTAYASGKNGNTIITGTATDITAFKSYSETLHKFNDKKNSILQILSHDLLGPLGNIQMSTGMLNDYAEISGNKQIAELLDVINASSRRSVTMIQDLINTEFLQSSEAAIVKERVDIVEKISVIIGQFKESPRVGQQRFSFETSCKNLFITIDVSKFMQVLNNLLSNALKFTPDDGKITIYLDDNDNDVLIKVQDNGIGIPADMQPFLFDKFTRARRAGIKGEPSTGLGMSIIKTIVEWHKGSIWVESTEGKGATFYIKMPKDTETA